MRPPKTEDLFKAEAKNNYDNHFKPVLERLQSLLHRQYGCDVSYYSVPQVKKNLLKPAQLKLKSGEKIYSENNIFIPLFVNDNFAGTAVINHQSEINKFEDKQIDEVVRLTLESSLINIDRLELLSQLEGQLKRIESEKTVRRIDSARKNFSSTTEETRQSNYHEINIPCLIQSSECLEALKMAHEIHDQSHRFAFLPIEQIDNSLNLQLADLINIGPITIFIKELELLNNQQLTTLDHFLDLESHRDLPQVIAHSKLSKTELAQSIGHGLTRKISQSHIIMDKNFSYYSKKDILNLLFKQTLVTDSTSNNPTLN